MSSTSPAALDEPARSRGATPVIRRGTDAPAIETHEITKAYGGGLLAVDHLSFRVERGEIFGFLGPNGAGKTTTMRMLLGLVRPTSGEAQVLGHDIRTEMPEILRGTGSIIENPTFYPYLSGRDNLRALARLTRNASAGIDNVLDLLDLTGAADRKFASYSLGMKQRLAVGAAILTRPDLLILDEPANGLDPAGIVDMRGLMKRLKDEGHTVLISSHVLHEVEQICDRIAILNRGKVVVEGRVDELLGSRSKIEVRIDRPQEAAAVLAAEPWVQEVTFENERLLVTAPGDRSAEITRMLSAQGLYLSEMRPHEQSLEQYFLDVTGGNDA